MLARVAYIAAPTLDSAVGTVPAVSAAHFALAAILLAFLPVSAWSERVVLVLLY